MPKVSTPKREDGGRGESGALGLPAAKRYRVHPEEIQVVAGVLPRRSPVSVAVVSILEGSIRTLDIGLAIIARGVGERLGIGVVQRVFEAVAGALAECRLAAVVVHARIRLSD